MSIEEARNLAAVLVAAADQAEADGKTEVDNLIVERAKASLNASLDELRSALSEVG